MIDKRVASAAEALRDTKDGSTVLLGGFGAVGQPNELIDALIEQGARHLTIVSNNAGVGRVGLARLLTLKRVDKIICSFPRSSDSVAFNELYAAGEIQLEIVPQGTLAERLRAAGAGIPAFYTPTGAGTVLEQGKEVREFKGRRYVLEEALHGDLALVQAWRADRWGNCSYRGTGRNFNPVMAAAAQRTVVQTRALVELGEMDPEAIITPGIYVQGVIQIDSPDPTVF